MIYEQFECSLRVLTVSPVNRSKTTATMMRKYADGKQMTTTSITMDARSVTFIERRKGTSLSMRSTSRLNLKRAKRERQGHVSQWRKRPHVKSVSAHAKTVYAQTGCFRDLHLSVHPFSTIISSNTPF